MAESSTTPLAVKLGINVGTRLALLHAPGNFHLDLPANVTIRRRAGGSCDVAVAFFTRAAQFQRRIELMERMVHPDGGLWVAWPKRSSGVPTDITDHVVRELALERSLVDNKVCAIDETWTALRLVWRREHRNTSWPTAAGRSR